MLARRIDQNPAHLSGRHRKEVRAVLPLDPVDIDEPQIRLVDQGGRLQRVSRALAVHVPLRQPPQFLVNERRQLVERLLIALAPCNQELCNWRRNR